MMFARRVCFFFFFGLQEGLLRHWLSAFDIQPPLKLSSVFSCSPSSLFESVLCCWPHAVSPYVQNRFQVHSSISVK